MMWKLQKDEVQVALGTIGAGILGVGCELPRNYLLCVFTQKRSENSESRGSTQNDIVFRPCQKWLNCEHYRLGKGI